MIAGRECINPFIAEALTFKDVLKQFNLKEKTCAKHDPSWEFDHWFATQQAGKLLRVRAQDAILDAMPSADTGVLLGAAVDKLNEVRRSELVVFRRRGPYQNGAGRYHHQHGLDRGGLADGQKHSRILLFLQALS